MTPRIVPNRLGSVSADALVQWFHGRPRWIQEAAARLLTQDNLTTADIRELVEICRQEALNPEDGTPVDGFAADGVHDANRQQTRDPMLSAPLGLESGDDVVGVEETARQQRNGVPDAELVERRKLKAEVRADLPAPQELHRILAERRHRIDTRPAPGEFESVDDLGSMHLATDGRPNAVVTAEAEESGPAHADEALGVLKGIAFLEERAQLEVDVGKGEG